MVTIGLAVLLAVGLVVAKISQRFRLPSVTGYILAGLLLGPTGFGIITEKSIGHGLDHFTHIALMLIAFGIGEHIEIKKIKVYAGSVFWTGLLEAIGAFSMVSFTVFILFQITDALHLGEWLFRDQLVLSMLLGAVSVATAPAATLMIVRELKARGPLTSSLMAVVAIDNGLAIMLFGLVLSLSHQIIGQADTPLFVAIGNGFLEILMSLILGVISGLLLEVALRKMADEGEMMTAGLAILLLCNELAVYMHLSPLLAGMAVGFTLVNKAERDVRVFRALNSFEPPIYVLFFTLAGSHLDIKNIGSTGLIGIVYFLARICGKMLGAQLGTRIGRAAKIVRKYIGIALIPQAGIAIGLIFLISSDNVLSVYSSIITPVVLTGVFLSELIGPLTSRFAIINAKEAIQTEKTTEKKQLCNGMTEKECDQFMRSEAGVAILPWTWGKLTPVKNPKNVVVFGATRRHTVNGIARIATIFAHHYQATPMAVFIQPPGTPPPPHNFEIERKEVETMGYKLMTEIVPDSSIYSGLVVAVEYNNAKAVVLSYPLHDKTSAFPEVLETVASHVGCPVIVVQFYGVLHTERILVPVIDMTDLEEVYPVVLALGKVGEHQITLLYMMTSDVNQELVHSKTKEISSWLNRQSEQVPILVKPVPTDARVKTIQDEAENHDIVVMGAIRTKGVRKFFFGSLADSLSKNLRKPLIVVYDAQKNTDVT
ncbi:cation:proton antiporter domain-containing protein [Desulfogranum japonicum]|uniref:cation:proton antiporter domain-containing protein n=1 Tax=Desulfogranum japonicum TaxID=231447 RepID=UPI00042502A1|nr:cation:proton antiporter [Desulfogranum japonicum]